MKKILPLIFFLVLFASASSQTTWFAQNSGINTALYSVSFPTESTGYAVGQSFKILKTTNGGTNWNVLSNPSNQNYKVVYFFNESVGILAGTDIISPYTSRVYKTTDGGNSWIETGTLENDPIGVYFINSVVGYIYGGDVSGTFMYKTINGGNSWGTTIFNGGQWGIGSVSFIDANTGVVFRRGGMSYYRTTTSGSTWDILSTNFGMFSSQFINNNSGFACGLGGYLAKSTNAGANWSYNRILGITDSLFSLKFTSFKVGYIVGQGSLILQTTDGGTNWTPLASPSLYSLRAMTFTNSLTGYAVGDKGTIIKTITGVVTDASNSNIAVPEKYSISQNYPNPFNPTTKISFSLPKEGFVSLKVYDVVGRMVKELVSETKAPGSYSVTFDASNFSSGIYFYRIETSNFIDTKRMVLVK